MEAEGEWLAVGQDGWALWHHPESTSVAFIRFGRRGTAIPIDEVHFMRLEDHDRLQANDLRILALGRVQSMASDPDIEPLLLGRKATDDLPILDPTKVSAEEAKARCEQMPERIRRSSLQISVPPKGQRDRYFYEILDTVYRRAASQSRHPAKDIADANGVPVSTVHSWLKAMRQALLTAERRDDAILDVLSDHVLRNLTEGRSVGIFTIEEEILEDGTSRFVVRDDPPNQP